MKTLKIVLVQSLGMDLKPEEINHYLKNVEVSSLTLEQIKDQYMENFKNDFQLLIVGNIFNAKEGSLYIDYTSVLTITADTFFNYFGLSHGQWIESPMFFNSREELLSNLTKEIALQSKNLIGGQDDNLNA